MAKKFVPKKRISFFNLIFKIIIIVLIIYLIYFLYNSVNKIKLANTNEEFLKQLLTSQNYLLEKNTVSPLNDLTNKLKKNITKNPLLLLENFYHVPIETASDLNLVIQPTEYIEDPKPEVQDNPQVYLYNTHQLEGYSKENLEEYNITPNVMMASYMLRESLNNQQIQTVVETSDMTTFLNSQGWNYQNSYKASRYFIKDALKKYPNLDLIIDIHRDAIPKKSSTIKIDNKNYAKILFVIGEEYKNYKKNLALANNLNKKIEKKYPGLSRGVMKKKGQYVDGVYNQDLSEKIILIECGGYKNTTLEVYNTMEVIGQIIKEYLEETWTKKKEKKYINFSKDFFL